MFSSRMSHISIAHLIPVIFLHFLGCDGVVHLRTCDASFTERNVDDEFLYAGNVGGLRFEISASAISSPTPSRFVPFSFVLVFRNLDWDTLYYSPRFVSLSDFGAKIPIDLYWYRDFKTGADVILQRDTIINVVRGDSTNLRFVTRRGDPRESWDGVWLKFEPLRTSISEASIVLDSVCLRLKRKGVDY